MRMDLARLLVPVRPEHEDAARLRPGLDVEVERVEGLVQARVPSFCGGPFRLGPDACHGHQLVEIPTALHKGCGEADWRRILGARLGVTKSKTALLTDVMDEQLVFIQEVAGMQQPPLAIDVRTLEVFGHPPCYRQQRRFDLALVLLRDADPVAGHFRIFLHAG